MKYKLKYMQYKLKLLLKPFYIVMYYIQRAKRGFSDKDMWSADMFISTQIAGILRWYVEKGHGVPMSYAREDDFIGQDVYYMINARDAEYKKYAALFEEYGKHGHAVNAKWKEMFGGLTDEEVNDMMTWLAKHFTELWD